MGDTLALAQLVMEQNKQRGLTFIDGEKKITYSGWFQVGHSVGENNTSKWSGTTCTTLQYYNTVLHYSACIARLCVACQSFHSDAMIPFFLTSHKPDFFSPSFFWLTYVCTRQSILAVDCQW